MKISVIIAACHGSAFIGEQLKSILLQTRLPDELLIGDDSWKDNETFQVVEKFRKEEKIPFKLKYFHNTPPRGVNGNFRFLAEQSSGEIIFFCDQDDWWLPEKIEKMSAIFEKDPECGAVCCFSTQADRNLSPLAKQNFSEIAIARKYGLEKKQLFPYFNKVRLAAAGHDMALRQSMFHLLPSWEDPLLYDDWCIQCCAAAERLALVPERLTLRRIHDQNLTVCPEYTPGNQLLTRFSSIISEEDRQREFLWLLGQKECFCKRLTDSPFINMVPEHHRKILKEFPEYLKRRIAYRERKLTGRIRLNLRLLKEYFIYGNGIRSLIRDFVGL